MTFQNNERNFDQQVAGEFTKTNQQSDVKEAKLFWCEIWVLKQ